MIWRYETPNWRDRKLEIIKSNFGDNKMSFGDIITRNGDKKCMEWR